MYKWNPVYIIIMKIKRDYEQIFGEIKEYNTITVKNALGENKEITALEYWIQQLNKQEYNDFVQVLQINQHNEFILIRYGLEEMQKGMWTDKNSIYRECRSVVMDIKNEALVLTPFRKFFNLNEVEENKLDNIQIEMDKAKSIEITNKLDGSMQSARWYNDKIFMAGSMSLSPKESWRLEDGYSKLTDNYKKMIKENPQYTFIFEYISLKDSHVVLYKKEQEGLYLLKMRNVYTGEQLSYNEILEFANKYDILMTEIENINFKEILKLSKTLRSDEKEGWVLDIDGHMIKLKCDDYIQLHRLLDKISSINVIIKNIADNKYDDMISKVPDSYKPRVQKIADYIFKYKTETSNEINKHYDAAPKNNKKEFMVWVNENVPKEIQGYVRNMYLGKETNVLRTANRYKKLNELSIDKSYPAIFSAIFANMEEIENE